MPVFENGAQRTLTDVFKTFTERGKEYADSWSEPFQPPGFVNAMRIAVEADCGWEANRLIRIAGLVDTKVSRIVAGGEFKRDSYIDLIAYLALMCELHEQYERSRIEPAPVVRFPARCVS